MVLMVFLFSYLLNIDHGVDDLPTLLPTLEMAMVLMVPFSSYILSGWFMVLMVWRSMTLGLLGVRFKELVAFLFAIVTFLVPKPEA